MNDLPRVPHYNSKTMQIPGYHIQQQIGAGGMAAAYLAIQESLGRRVVLKILHTPNHQSVPRFVNEGRILASINHPNIITIYDIGVAGELLYMSMEYVEGGDLRSQMDSNVIPPAEALDIVARIGSGLSAAHKRGIVHRDVKPANILFRKDGTPLLSDFGIAKQLTIDHDLTSTGAFLGSPNYMAPEQAEAGPIDGRVDIYSLGIIFYEMLTGSKPYHADSLVEVIIQHRQAPVPSLPPGLEQFQDLLNLMVAKDPKDRFRDAESLLHYLQHMGKKGMTRSGSELIEKVNFDATYEPPPALATKISLPLPWQAKRRLYVLGTLLGVVIVGYAALLYVESLLDLEQPPSRRIDPTHPELLPAVIKRPLAPTAAKSSNPSNASAKAGPAHTDPATLEVIKALHWLAKKSLDDYRLTYPPQDNAYYYYSRLLEIDPGSQEAWRGLLEIAGRFSFLAERELAENNYEKAHRYITIGLQIDPTNKTLLTLQSLAQPRRQSFLDRLFGSFR